MNPPVLAVLVQFAQHLPRSSLLQPVLPLLTPPAESLCLPLPHVVPASCDTRQGLWGSPSGSFHLELHKHPSRWRAGPGPLSFSHTLFPPSTGLHGVLSLSPPPLTSQRQSPAPSITRSLHRSPCLPWMELALLFRMRGHLLSSTMGFYLNSELAEKKLVLLLQITSQ